MSLLINLYIVFVDESEINNLKEYNACFLLLMKTYKYMQVRNTSSQTKCQTTSVSLYE